MQLQVFIVAYAAAFLQAQFGRPKARLRRHPNLASARFGKQTDGVPAPGLNVN